MGSIAKSGTSQIVEVLSPAEKPTKHGLIYAATPASDIVCGPSQVASGIGLQVFMTGRGTSFGHTLTPLYPSLVQLKTDTKHIKALKGIRADCIVTASCNGKTLAKARGDVIFTDYGVSGNAVFSVSSYITDKQNVTLSLEFLPDFSAEQIEQSIAVQKAAGREESELLSGTLHNQIGRAVIKRAGTASPREIVRTLKNFTLEVCGNLGFDYAQVTKGGINMGEVTGVLESRLAKNLFFAGEILDVDGDCGGYNLQWAFTSGMTVAREILNRL